jgi:hypothetical protein
MSFTIDFIFLGALRGSASHLTMGRKSTPGAENFMERE